jgi:hypothetical protein
MATRRLSVPSSFEHEFLIRMHAAEIIKVAGMMSLNPSIPTMRLRSSKPGGTFESSLQTFNYGERWMD